MNWSDCHWLQVNPISELSIESYIKNLLSSRASKLLETIAEDNFQQMNMLFQALADGLNLATAYSIRST